MKINKKVIGYGVQSGSESMCYALRCYDSLEALHKNKNLAKKWILKQLELGRLSKKMKHKIFKVILEKV